MYAIKSRIIIIIKKLSKFDFSTLSKIKLLHALCFYTSLYMCIDALFRVTEKKVMTSERKIDPTEPL